MEKIFSPPFNFFNLKNQKKPLFIELNITGLLDELDIFTIERLFKEFSSFKLQWLLLGINCEIFLHSYIKTFFILLKKYNIKVYLLKTNGVYIKNVDFEDILNLNIEMIFFKKEEYFEKKMKTLFIENLESFLNFKNLKKQKKPKIFLSKLDFEKDEIEKFDGLGANFINGSFFDLLNFEKISPFYLRIDSNGFCYFYGDQLKKISSIFFNKILKVWKLRKKIK